MKEILRKILFGEPVIREYSTVTVTEGIREKAWLQDDEGTWTLDISQCHFLLCLDPIVFGVWLKKDVRGPALESKSGYRLHFRDTALPPGRDIGKGALATIRLDLYDKIEEEGGSLFLFRLKAVKIAHVPFWKAWLIYSKFYKKPGLTFGRVKEFVAAYSYPRRVRIISFKEEGYYNIFPMDLLGEIPEAGRCVFGLRHTNRTLSRIVDTKKIVMSEVPAGYKDTIYLLGSHHGSAPPPPDKLPFGVIPSDRFGFLVPEWAESYKEIKILRTIDLGSHLLLWGEPVGESNLRPSTHRLYHIHFLLYLHQLKNGTAYPLV